MGLLVTIPEDRVDTIFECLMDIPVTKLYTRIHDYREINKNKLGVNMEFYASPEASSKGGICLCRHYVEVTIPEDPPAGTPRQLIYGWLMIHHPVYQGSDPVPLTLD